MNVEQSVAADAVGFSTAARPALMPLYSLLRRRVESKRVRAPQLLDALRSPQIVGHLLNQAGPIRAESSPTIPA
jgi:hypothetical protein